MRYELTHFKPEEFTCKCGCGLQNMKDTFLWKLEFARHEAQIPFVVNSGSRCPKHNEEEGGTKTSDHLSGEGADIRVTGSWERYKVVKAAIQAGIRRIGVANGFIHLGDNIEDNPAGLWSY